MPALDLLVIGSGVSGLSAAVRAGSAHRLRVGVITKGQLHQTTTRWAQGGVAAVLGGTDDPDSTDLHMADTLSAGAGLCDIDAVRVLVDEGPVRVSDLIAMGAIFDRDHEGDYMKAREGGHTQARILHARGDATGAEIERALVVAVHDTAASLVEHAFADSLLMDNGACVGVRYQDANGTLHEMEARNVLLAAGGAGQLYSVTTNPVEATGDGIAMALAAGAALGDTEFVQFHPTALHHEAMPRPLLSEALRGHGALLRDANRERFVDELEPRDVVSRAMMRTMIEQAEEHLWLDATGLEDFAVRFPTIHRSLELVGLDATTDLLPIAPAAHYTCGGVITDLRGATTVPGLWAAGEVACSGVHGANRLASNSLLEGMVFGPRAVDAIAAGAVGPEPTGAMRTVLTPDDARVTGRRLDPPEPPRWGSVDSDPAKVRRAVQASMTRGAGVLRDRQSLATTAAELEELISHVPAQDSDPAWLEIRNLITLGRAVVIAAASREESRGAHTRDDFPATSDDWMLRQVMVRA
ncbi:MAG: L-aspartate oxidase [Acidimicrobiales bacterium]|nr:L-aspartate oxidase [Acidimicrobiales bacterium]